jgi:hypothetical protein
MNIRTRIITGDFSTDEGFQPDWLVHYEESETFRAKRFDFPLKSEAVRQKELDSSEEEEFSSLDSTLLFEKTEGFGLFMILVSL